MVWEYLKYAYDIMATYFLTNNFLKSNLKTMILEVTIKKSSSILGELGFMILDVDCTFLIKLARISTLQNLSIPLCLYYMYVYNIIIVHCGGY